MNRDKKEINIKIITGLSGAGKSQAVKSFEDLGFFCIDNLPPSMIPSFVELCYSMENEVQKPISHIAIVVDIRVRDFLNKMDMYLMELKEKGFYYEIVFLEAAEEVLVRRFKETRRNHPLNPKGRAMDGIQEEMKILAPYRDMATYVIDTSYMTAKELNNYFMTRFTESTKGEMLITIMSFGYKKGLPLDADIVFDVRFMRNPYYVPELKEKTGLHPDVYHYIFNENDNLKTVENFSAIIREMIPGFIRQDKRNLVIAVGCTGGKHRSVATVER